jgi:hypothetical protein
MKDGSHRFRKSKRPAKTHAQCTFKSKKQEKRDRKKAERAGLEMQLVHSSALQRRGNVSTSVYKREKKYPPISATMKPLKRFMIESDVGFREVLKSSYEGFEVEPKEAFPDIFHNQFRSALDGLVSQRRFKFDITQPAGLGTKLAKTYVTRCVLGDPGITYKYLGLRIFAYPWRRGEIGATPEAVAIGDLNEMLIEHTANLLKKSGKSETGSCRYNLSLINRSVFLPCDLLLLKLPL